MNRLLLTLATTFTVSILIFSNPTDAQQRSAGEKIERSRIINGPVLESATDNSAIINWTTNTSGGVIVHYGIVHYGTNPKDLSQTAKSPSRWNKSLPYMIYRVRINGLKPGTTYYYALDSVLPNETDTEARSTVKQFTTLQHQ